MNILFPLRFSLMRLGGAGTYNQLLIRYLGNNFKIFDLTLMDNVRYANIQKTGYAYRIKRYVLTMFDILIFNNIIKKGDITLVHLSPSLGYTAVNRDISYARKCINLGVPFVTFFHGWNKRYQEYLEMKGKVDTFRSIFNKSNTIFVLANEFRDKLIEWGFDKWKIIVETTMVDDSLLEGFDIHKKLHSVKKKKKFQILFLSRTIKEKGIYEALDTYFILREKGVPVNLTVAGDGLELPAAKHYVTSKGIKDVKFPGFVTAKEKIEQFKNADTYIFPTYTEGMPITILEAMAFGLPVVTRPVGGIKDFFENGKHGFITESKSPEVFVSLLETLIVNERLRHEMAVFNYKYAQERFMASKVTKRVEAVYLDIMKS